MNVIALIWPECDIDISDDDVNDDNVGFRFHDISHPITIVIVDVDVDVDDSNRKLYDRAFRLTSFISSESSITRTT